MRKNRQISTHGYMTLSKNEALINYRLVDKTAYRRNQKFIRSILSFTIYDFLRDMEGAAILQACYSNQLYCLCYKVISDMYGSGSTTEQYQKNLEKCLKKIGEKITGIIQKVGGEK